MKFVRKLFSSFSHLLNFIIIGAFATWVSYLLNIWTGCSKGNDAAGHIFKVKVIAQFWPYFNWTHTWGGGMPQFLRYPYLSYLPLVFLHRQFGIAIELLLTSAGVLAVIISAVGIYLLVFELTKTKIVSLVSALVYSLTPASWSYAFSGGIYARAFATPFLVLALWSFVRYLKSKPRQRSAFFLTVVFLGLTTLSHYVVGFVAFVMVFLLGLFVIKDLKQKFILPLKIFLPAGLLTAVFNLPFLLSKPSTRRLGGLAPNIESVSWRDLLYLFDRSLELSGNLLNRLSPFLIPLSLALFLFVFLFRRERLFRDNLLFRTILFFAFLSAILLVWVKVIFPSLALLYVVVGIPVGMLHYLAIVLAPLVGILLFLASSSGKLKFLPSFLLLLVIGIWTKAQYKDVLGSTGIIRFLTKCDYVVELHEKIEEIFTDLDYQFNYRFGLEDGGTGGWFNTRFPYIPQTRDYFGQGVVDHDQRFYLIYSLFHEKDNYQETNFLMDWWGIKHFMVKRDEEVGDKYLSRPEIYYPLSRDEFGFDIFEFANPSPIFTASNSLPVLFIGKSASYKIFFRDFAPANLNSKYLIPVHKGEFIDDYKEGELKKFPIIILYDYQYKNQDKTVGLLQQYIENGGGLIIESKKEDDLSQILPIASFERKNFGREWHLSETVQGKEVLGEIDFSAFGPAVFDEGPWEVSVATEVKEESQILLLEANRPILVSAAVGKGRIIWSGLNLPYHIDAYKSEEESRLLGRLIAWVSRGDSIVPPEMALRNDSLVYETPAFTAEFIHPEKRKLIPKKQVSGVLFKEFSFPNWRAFVNGKKVDIYKAGPEFMYVPGPFWAGDEIIFSYQLPFWPYGVGAGVSLITLVALVVYLFKGEIPFVPAPLSRWKKRLASWWEKE